jgi:uncharacterized protein DUF6580
VPGTFTFTVPEPLTGTLTSHVSDADAQFCFFGVTNFGVWAFGSLFPKTAAGLLACYVAAIPFFKNTLVGDAIYTAVLFGGLR